MDRSCQAGSLAWDLMESQSTRLPMPSWQNKSWYPMRSMGLALMAGLGFVVAALAGCVSSGSEGLLTLVSQPGTREIQFGHIRPGQPLVTLIVTQDRSVVWNECADAGTSGGPLLGCQRSSIVHVMAERAVHAVKIVRYADVLPSPLAFEIEAHELCHAIAAIQSIDDPCHTDPAGRINSAREVTPERHLPGGDR